MPEKNIGLQLGAVTLNTLCALSKKKGESKTLIVKRALALYCVIDARLERGERIFIGTDERKAELVIIL